MKRSVRVVKRLMDVAAASLGILASAPLMVAIATAIRLTSPGPILYRQRRAGMLGGRERVGWAGAGGNCEHKRGPPETLGELRELNVYKFRTMVPDAEKSTGVVLAEEDDPRITRIGRLLRRTRLDELPQLFNVLRGEMSLVGPRPERPELIRNLALAIPFFEERMRDIKPGITGLAQVNLSYTGRLPTNSRLARLRETLTNPFHLEEAEGALADDMRTKMLYDFAYAAALEDFIGFLRTDLGIIVRTPLVMFLTRTGQ